MKHYILITLFFISIPASFAGTILTKVDPESTKAQYSLVNKGCIVVVSSPTYGPVCRTPSTMKVPMYTVKRVQEQLKKMGFYRGTVDGLIGKKTTQSIRSFQSKYKAKVNGLINEQLFDLMKKSKL